MLNTIAVPDTVILDRIRKNNLKGWEDLYDQYASSMLSVIYKLTDDRKKSEDILVDVFTSIDFKNFVFSLSSKLNVHLSTFVFSYTIRSMRQEGMEPDAVTISGLPKILQFLYQKDKRDDDHSAGEWKASRPIYKSVHAYKWLPVFGFNMYG